MRPNEYNHLRNRSIDALSALPGVVVLDILQGFEHRGDGLHPSDEASDRVARRIVAKVQARGISAAR